MKHGSRTEAGRTVGGVLRYRGPAGRGRRAVLVSAVTVAGSLSSLVLLVAPAGATTPTSIATQVSATSITLGPSGTVQDTATVQGNATHGSPTGHVTFYVCKIASTQTLTTGPCAAAPANFVSTNNLNAGASNTSTANSSVFTPTSAGTWCFSASYAGDVNYSSSTDNTSAGNLDANECLLVMKEPVTITSTSSASSVQLGTSVTDSVTVAGAFLAGSPTGTVVFYVCQTGTSQTLTTGPCPATGTPEDPGVTLIAGGGSTASAMSSAFTPTSAGTWCFSATYGGDSNYSANAANTNAGNADPNECVLVSVISAPPFTITSANSASAIAGQSFTFTVTATPTSPAPKIKKHGKLPKAIKFRNNNNGTATISGIASPKKTGIYNITITATWGKGKTKHVATQAFTLSVSP